MNRALLALALLLAPSLARAYAVGPAVPSSPRGRSHLSMAIPHPHPYNRAPQPTRP